MEHYQTDFPKTAITCLGDFATSLGLPLQAAEDRSFSFEFENGFTLSFHYPVTVNQTQTMSGGSELVLMSLTNARDVLIQADTMQRHLAKSQYNETMDRAIIAGLSTQKHPVLIASFEAEAFNLQSLELTLDYLMETIAN